MQKRILILGGTGLLGKPVVTALKKAGFQVRLMVRDIEKTKTLIDKPVDLVHGDVTNLNSLEKAITDCAGVHISVGGEVDQLSAENVSKLAIKQNIERITYISGSTVSEKNRWFPMVAQKLNAEKAIASSGVAYTIFCPTWPMEMLVRFARNGQPFMMGKQLKPLHWFAADDLGGMVATAYLRKEAENKRFFVHGPEAMTMKQALERYCRVFHPDGKPVSIMPIWLAKTISFITGNKQMKFAVGLMNYFDKIGEMGDPKEANEILDAPGTTLDDWMKKQKS
ncbi:MAG: NAD(P)H-binding protein [Chitinispirillia bacterium]|jgi:uncharacterized protein YbjT (DUF2867 family)